VLVSDYIEKIEINAGVEKEISFVYTMPPDSRIFDSVTVNLQDSLNDGFVNTASFEGRAMRKLLALLTSKANAASTGTISARIGASDSVDVCKDGYLYGPFTVMLDDSDDPVTVDPPTVSATPTTVQIINTGSFAICLQFNSPVDLQLSATNVAVDRTPCDEEPADFNGTWSGTYTCLNDPCPDDIDQNISLTVTQSGYSASYTDGFASFEGTVCGNTYTFNGGGEGYTESGTLVLNTDGSATKYVTWQDTLGLCGGECTDQLERVD
jgi:hypothetical protein